MENKTTKEYAVNLASDTFPIIEGFANISKDTVQEHKRNGFIEGYMKAIQETNAPELLEALIKAHDILDGYNKPSYTESFDRKQVINAINKATK